MSVTPKIKSFLIADTVIREQNTNKWSVIGIFEKIFTFSFPCTHHSLALYVRLADGDGEFNIRVEFCDDKNAILAAFEGLKINIHNRLVSPEIGIQTYNLPLPKPGKYNFLIYFNDELAEISIPLEAILVEKTQVK
ncbi:hypothetical protein SCALIN_C34_0030 [Candidatus Scalindua japonica]|uniref:Uncharacterized protein n=1 Tax=Candidatus Scalindua japonica TaxID=1284222 RepID=A0A286U2X4_9BACT|nr:hypothetical protein [Candidatus Scalindua japonica]GAX62479.1 hypothetical protein SCALIN_C34_0030 [Candidatus Scalindua japonica]